jgi:glutamate racemase
MVERLLRRSLPGAALIRSGEEIAREVAETLERKGLLRPPGREGDYRFACSGDAAAFRKLGSRFLQMPLGDVTVVDPEAVAAAAGP